LLGVKKVAVARSEGPSLYSRDRVAQATFVFPEL
jgi:hypothetical protein